MRIRDLKEKKEYLLFGAFVMVALVISVILMKYTAPYVNRLDLGRYGYFGVLVLGVIINATVLIPVPTMMPVLASLTGEYNIFLIVLAYAVGATIGEGSSYWTGRLGRKIVVKKEKKKRNSRLNEAVEFVGEHSGLNRVKKGISNKAEKETRGWLKKHGGLGIFFLSLQPILPFDVAGLIAGSTKYPYWKFCVFCFLGRVPKYLLTIMALNAGLGLWEAIFK